MFRCYKIIYIITQVVVNNSIHNTLAIIYWQTLRYQYSFVAYTMHSSSKYVNYLTCYELND